MKVILRKNVPGLGQVNDVKEVSEGYARNYLIPRGLAEIATETAIQQAQRQMQAEKEKKARQRAEAEAFAARLAALTLVFKAKAGEKGRLYGSITAQQIAEAVEHQLHQPFDKRWLELEQPLRQLGEHVIPVKLEGGVRTTLRVEIEAEV